MKRLIFLVFFLMLAVAGWTKNLKLTYNPYSQLIGMTTGGEYFFLSQRSYGDMGVFFETVIEPWVGVEMHVAKAGFPITNQNVTIIGGEKTFLEVGTLLRFYMPFWQPFFTEVGFNYNEFLSGYAVSGTTYTQFSDSWIENFFSASLGFGVTAQISSDLFSQIGLRVNVAVNGKDYGLRFYLNFAYGI